MSKQIDGTEFACLTINADLEAENKNLKKQLALTEKALELACDNLYDINFQLYNTEMDFKEYFEEFDAQAKRSGRI